MRSFQGLTFVHGLALGLGLLSVNGVASAAENGSEELPRGVAQANFTAGIVFPAELTPKEICKTSTGVGPLLRADNGWAPLRHLEISPYVSFSAHPISSNGCSGVTDFGGASILFFSGGAGVKWRTALSPRMTLRLGATVGVDALSLYIPGERYPGFGLGVGALAELRAEVSSNVALLGQLGFVGQPLGFANLPADTGWGKQDFAFLPVFFVTVGPELFVEPHRAANRAASAR